MKINEKYSEKLIELLTENLNRFNRQIKYIEVQLSDEDGSNNNKIEKLCFLEARLEGMQPVAVSSNANTIDHAIEGAIEKLKYSLDSILGRSSIHSFNH